MVLLDCPHRVPVLMVYQTDGSSHVERNLGQVRLLQSRRQQPCIFFFSFSSSFLGLGQRHWHGRRNLVVFVTSQVHVYTVE